MNRYLLTELGDYALGELSQPDVRRWVASLDQRGLAPATVGKAYALLAKIMGAAVDARLILESPCRRVPLPKVEREEMRFLNPTEISELASAMDERYRALVLVGAYCGLRIGETAGLKRQRVNLLRRSLDVAEILVESEGHLHHGAPKTKAGRRTVGISGACRSRTGVASCTLGR